MADTGIFATTSEIQRKAGANANATYTAEAYTNSFVAQAESLINVESGYNWSDKYATLNVDVKKILTLAASNKAAQYCILANTNGFLSESQVQTTLQTLEADYDKCITLLRRAIASDDKRTFMLNA